MTDQLPAQVEAAKKDLAALRQHAYGLGDTDTDDTASATDQEPKEQEQPVKDTAQATLDDVPEETWRSKFVTLQGKYDAEVPRLHESMRQMREQLLAMQSDKHDVAPPAPQQSGVNRKALEEYDAEFGKLVDVIEQQREQIKKMEAYLSQVWQAQAMTEDQIFQRDLRAAIPDFDQINSLPEFVSWLAENDGFSRRTRKENGEAALAARDVQTVAAIISQFKSQYAGKKKAADRPANIVPESRQTAPDAAMQTGQAPSFTNAEFHELYERRRLNVYPFTWKGQIVRNADEARTLANEVQQAVYAGRVYR